MDTCSNLNVVTVTAVPKADLLLFSIRQTVVAMSTDDAMGVIIKIAKAVHEIMPRPTCHEGGAQHESI